MVTTPRRQRGQAERPVAALGTLPPLHTCTMAHYPNPAERGETFPQLADKAQELILRWEEAGFVCWWTWLVRWFSNSALPRKKNHTASPGARRSGKKSCRSCSYFPALGSFGSSSPLTEPGIYCHYSNSSGKFLMPTLATQ